MGHTSIAGRLLVAAPVLTDPNFDRTIVLMLSHDVGGALGLVLNRLDVDIPSSPLIPWVAASCVPRSLFSGGPVQPDGLIGLVSTPTVMARATTPGALFTPFISLGDRTVGTVDLSQGVEALEAHGLTDVQLRVFRGYSGWGPGQLDHELRRPGWLVVPAQAGDAFDDEPWTLWRRVLARQRDATRWLAHFPDDLSAN